MDFFCQAEQPVARGRNYVQNVDNSPETVENQFLMGKTSLICSVIPFSSPPDVGGWFVFSPYFWQTCGMENPLFFFPDLSPNALGTVSTPSAPDMRLHKTRAPKYAVELPDKEILPLIHSFYC